MRTIKMSDVGDDIVDDIIKGAIFIYPTDTIYGIGCNALNDEQVKKIFLIKKRDESMPLSVIAPNFEWISENCIADIDVVKKYLPGPYTLILRKKKNGFLGAASAGRDTIGVRIINHPIMRYFEMAGVPFVTTSVNASGEEPICDVSKLPSDIRKNAYVVIDDGVIQGKPSKVIDLSGEKERIVRK
ncbi:MAG: L-threonylcarbamoyladenylate synthase [archaeon]